MNVKETWMALVEDYAKASGRKNGAWAAVQKKVAASLGNRSSGNPAADELEVFEAALKDVSRVDCEIQQFLRHFCADL